MSTITLLAIETSCDETALAVVRGNGLAIEVLASALASQVDIHAATGGVVPEVAAREHVAVMRPLLQKVLEESGVEPNKLDAIAVTAGPGLPPALAVGVTAARTLAYTWDKPLVPVHHIEGHIYSALLQSAENSKLKFQISNSQKLFPALALIVSGGHTLLIRMTDQCAYNVIGSTRDDAAGEAFDKVARMLGLPYPGGARLSAIAQQGNPTAYAFPRPMVREKNLDMSFSGLKTAVYYTLRELSQEQRTALQADVAASFEQAVVDTLVSKTAAALEAYPTRLLLLAGGVAANDKLRAGLKSLAAQQGIQLRQAPLALCTDNAVMIGLAGVYAYRAGRLLTWKDVDSHARLDITTLAQAPVEEVVGP